MKKILIPISNSFAVRGFLRSDFAKLLLMDSGVKIVFLAPLDKIDYYRKEFASPNVLFEELPPISKNLTEIFFKNLEGAMIHTKTVKMVQWFHLVRTGTKSSFLYRLPTFIWQRVAFFFGQFKLARKTVRVIYFLIKSKEVARVIETFAPDLIFCPTLIYGGEFALLKEAKRRGIKTVGMIASWDNLYSKTFLRVMPDKLLVQTESLKRQAIDLADCPVGKIIIVGVPQYDRLFSKQGLIGREQFIKSLGGDPNKKTILYALSGKVGVDNDEKILALLRELVVAKKWPDVQILVRPYPKRDFSAGKISKIKSQYGFLTHHSLAQVGHGRDAWEFDEDSLSLLINSLAHAEIVISTYSTFFIEAAIMDRPLIAVAFSPGSQTDYWNSASRFFDWDHLNDIKKHNGIWLAKSEADLVLAIDKFLETPDLLSSGRRQIVAEQCHHLDAGSAKRIAAAIGAELN